MPSGQAQATFDVGLWELVFHNLATVVGAGEDIVVIGADAKMFFALQEKIFRRCDFAFEIYGQDLCAFTLPSEGLVDNIHIVATHAGIENNHIGRHRVAVLGFVVLD